MLSFSEIPAEFAEFVQAKRKQLALNVLTSSLAGVVLANLAALLAMVATNDKDLKRRIRKIPGVPIMYVANHRYTIEQLPDKVDGGAGQTRKF